MRGRQGEEGAGLVHGRAERGRGAAVADQVEQVSVLSGGRVGPLAQQARAVQADEERASGRAVQIARDPVAALLLAPRQIAAADFLGAARRAPQRFRLRETENGAWRTSSGWRAKKEPVPKRRPVLGSEWNVFPYGACGRRYRRRLGVRAVAVPVPIRFVEELHPPAGGE